MTGKQPFVKDAPLNLVYVADGKRMKNANEEDQKLFSAADAGFIAQNVYLYCAAAGLGCVVRGLVDRDALGRVLRLGPGQRVIAAQSVGYRASAG